MSITPRFKRNMDKISNLFEERRRKAENLVEQDVQLYPAGYPVSITAAEAVHRFGESKLQDDSA